MSRGWTCFLEEKEAGKQHEYPIKVRRIHNLHLPDQGKRNRALRWESAGRKGKKKGKKGKKKQEVFRKGWGRTCDSNC